MGDIGGLGTKSRPHCLIGWDTSGNNIDYGRGTFHAFLLSLPVDVENIYFCYDCVSYGTNPYIFPIDAISLQRFKG